MNIYKFFIIILFFSCLMRADLIIVRHGQGEHNVQRFFSTDPDDPNHRHAYLTPLGIEQINETARALKREGVNPQSIAKVYVSPLHRTCHTAQILQEEGVFESSQQLIDRRVSEVYAGAYEGKSAKEFPWHTWDYSHGKEYGGETEPMILARVMPLVKEIMPIAQDEHVIFVTHGGVAMVLIEALTGVREVLPTRGYRIISLPRSFNADQAV